MAEQKQEWVVKCTEGIHSDDDQQKITKALQFVMARNNGNTKAEDIGEKLSKEGLHPNFVYEESMRSEDRNKWYMTSLLWARYSCWEANGKKWAIESHLRVYKPGGSTYMDQGD